MQSACVLETITGGIYLIWCWCSSCWIRRLAYSILQIFKERNRLNESSNRKWRVSFCGLNKPCNIVFDSATTQICFLVFSAFRQSNTFGLPSNPYHRHILLPWQRPIPTSLFFDRSYCLPWRFLPTNRPSTSLLRLIRQIRRFLDTYRLYSLDLANMSYDITCASCSHQRVFLLQVPSIEDHWYLLQFSCV